MSRWARFRLNDGRVGFGILEDGRLLEYEGDFFAEKRPTGRAFAPGELSLRSPCEPSKIVALWNNFHALCEKLGKTAPTHPQFLLKPGSCVIGPNEPIRRPASYPGKIAYEGELGIVIGKKCTDVRPEAAAEHIFGYTCVNDVTALAVLNENVDFAQWCRSKGYDTFGCLGPAIATGLAPRAPWRAVPGTPGRPARRGCRTRPPAVPARRAARPARCRPAGSERRRSRGPRPPTRRGAPGPGQGPPDPRSPRSAHNPPQLWSNIRPSLRHGQ